MPDPLSSALLGAHQLGEGGTKRRPLLFALANGLNLPHPLGISRSSCLDTVDDLSAAVLLCLSWHDTQAAHPASALPLDEAPLCELELCPPG